MFEHFGADIFPASNYLACQLASKYAAEPYKRRLCPCLQCRIEQVLPFAFPDRAGQHVQYLPVQALRHHTKFRSSMYAHLNAQFKVI